MKKKLLSIVLCFALIFGCCAAFTPSMVEAKKFSKKKVKITVKKCVDHIYLPEDDISCNKVILVTNKNKKLASVCFDVVYYKNNVEVYKTSHNLTVAQICYMGLGNDEEMPKFDKYKIKNIKIKKMKGKQIPKKKVIIKKAKKQDGYKRISIKNNSKYDGIFERAKIYYNKKGKIIAISSTCFQELKAGKKTIIYDDGYNGKYKKVKTYYNYIKAKLN